MQLDGEACCTRRFQQAEQKPRLDYALWHISQPKHCPFFGGDLRCSRFREYSCKTSDQGLQILNLVSSSLSYGFTASFHVDLTLMSSCQRSLPWLSYLK
uniref:Uncharacterized protein n=1 Tax=Pan troglodytes TaxID=9598 RepID=G2HGK2_PANTR|nr:hypothetical protein [Pan troglodytes]